MVDESESANATSESTSVKTPKGSKNLIIICAAVIGITGLCFWANATKQSETPQVMAGEIDGAVRSMKEKVVYAIKDVPQGTVIPSDALEEKEIASSKVPEGALTSASLAAGTNARFGISVGQLLTTNDVQRPQDTRPLMSTARIPKGTKITEDAVHKAPVIEGQAPRSALVKMEEVVGRVAKRDIAPDELIFEEYLAPKVPQDGTNKGTKRKKK